MKLNRNINEASGSCWSSYRTEIPINEDTHMALMEIINLARRIVNKERVTMPLMDWWEFNELNFWINEFKPS